MLLAFSQQNINRSVFKNMYAKSAANANYKRIWNIASHILARTAIDALFAPSPLWKKSILPLSDYIAGLEKVGLCLIHILLFVSLFLINKYMYIYDDTVQHTDSLDMFV